MPRSQVRRDARHRGTHEGGRPLRRPTYDHDPSAPSYGLEAVAALGVPAGHVFETLLADVDGQLVVAVGC